MNLFQIFLDPVIEIFLASFFHISSVLFRFCQRIHWIRGIGIRTITSLFSGAEHPIIHFPIQIFSIHLFQKMQIFFMFFVHLHSGVWKIIESIQYRLQLTVIIQLFHIFYDQIAFFSNRNFDFFFLIFKSSLLKCNLNLFIRLDFKHDSGICFHTAQAFDPFHLCFLRFFDIDFRCYLILLSSPWNILIFQNFYDFLIGNRAIFWNTTDSIHYQFTYIFYHICIQITGFCIQKKVSTMFEHVDNRQIQEARISLFVFYLIS